MIPSARPTPKVISASTASQIEPAGTGPLNEGSRTWSVARPSAEVNATDDTANSIDPATDTKNGLGCIRTYATTRRIPRTNRPPGSPPILVCAAEAMPPMMPRMTDHRPWFASYASDVAKTLEPYPDETLFSLLEAASR